MGIQVVLKANKKFSDAGVTKSMPPTFQDLQTRIKHTTDSVEYNLDHAEDHLAELIAQLGKLESVNRGKASELAVKVCNFLNGVHDDVERFKLGE